MRTLPPELLVATVIPFYLLTLRQPELGQLPLFGGIALWVLVVFFGRELLITWLRTAGEGHPSRLFSEGEVALR